MVRYIGELIRLQVKSDIFYPIGNSSERSMKDFVLKKVWLQEAGIVERAKQYLHDHQIDIRH